MTTAKTASEQTAAAEEAAAMTPTPPELMCKPTVFEALTEVKRAVGAVGKSDKNAQQGFNFRGIDRVVNAVGPALIQYGVNVVPKVKKITHETYTTRNGAVMRSAVVETRYRFYGPHGDHVDATVYGEAADAGDKSTTQAQSVAYRVALLQALSIPTGDPDPDASSHERGTPDAVLPEGWRSAAEQREAWDELREATKALPEPDGEEVKAWVKAHVPNLGSFTAALADEWRNALPAAEADG